MKRSAKRALSSSKTQKTTGRSFGVAARKDSSFGTVERRVVVSIFDWLVELPRSLLWEILSWYAEIIPHEFFLSIQK